MPYLIATDEAGYGPKLGPLVIVATAWKYPAVTTPEDAFQSLHLPIEDSRCGTLRIDDSKRVFRRSKGNSLQGRLPILDEICQGAARWARLPDPVNHFSAWIAAVSKNDYAAINEDRCLSDLAKQTAAISTDQDIKAEQVLIDHWSIAGVSLEAIQARVITPAVFNSMIEQGMNKADLLTEATCRLAYELTRIVPSAEHDVIIRSDRHGGRAFYGAALQHVGEGANLAVLKEGKPASQYRLTRMTESGTDQVIDWSFTIGGDSFAPVAMSSIIAKWLRERAMASLNRYFLDRMPKGRTLVPTAGYPSDAARFLSDIARAGLRAAIPDSSLIRKR